MPPCLPDCEEELPPCRERNPIFSGTAPTFSPGFPNKAKKTRNETEYPLSTFAPTSRRLFYSCNARNPGSSPGRASSKKSSGGGNERCL